MKWLAEGATVHEAQWDPAKHPKGAFPQNRGWWSPTGGSGGASSKLDRAGTDGKPRAVDQHSAPPQMLELANAWWKTHSLLQQCRRDIERLPTRIASEQAKLASGDGHSNVHWQNLAKAQRDLEIAKSALPKLEAQSHDLEQRYHDLGYDEVEYSTWTPGETLIGGRGIEQVGSAVDLGGSLAGLKPTGIEIDIALAAGSILQLGKLALGKALSKAPKSFFKPSVTDPKLQNLTQDLYKGAKTPNPIGSGSAADAIRNELKTGQATYGRFHSQKGQKYARALEKWLEKNPNASAADRAAAQQMLNDLRLALEGN